MSELDKEFLNKPVSVIYKTGEEKYVGIVSELMEDSVLLKPYIASEEVLGDKSAIAALEKLATEDTEPMILDGDLIGGLRVLKNTTINERTEQTKQSYGERSRTALLGRPEPLD
ncbi:hypothetical protein HOK51_01800 [Candidatus Woesearchaeota archaeon]|jgi:hypothetical protein|nr:hypothetical protein [Candidatus Woesearchaeota archaeon]MBT6518549.1 hypothetical protein [Candidatus Woesearchaeota archaeon]MBT7368421.1 hypothetical protein [Candidatus Woesearchaeota archaeon]